MIKRGQFVFVSVFFAAASLVSLCEASAATTSNSTGAPHGDEAVMLEIVLVLSFLVCALPIIAVVVYLSFCERSADKTERIIMESFSKRNEGSSKTNN